MTAGERNTGDWVQILAAVRSPLSFITLGLLLADGSVLSLVGTLTEFRTPLVWTLILSVPGYVGLVVVLAVWRPEVLLGVRPFQPHHAEQLASDLFLALDGPLSNLVRSERQEAWETMAGVLAYGSPDDTYFSAFRAEVASKLRSLLQLNRRVRDAVTMGPTEAVVVSAPHVAE